MASAIASRRLRKELLVLQQDPPPGVIAEPQENDILTWYYGIHGPSDTPYEGGIYIGKLKFPSEYPMKGPSIYMLTPSGRFQVGVKLCMSMSDFHPEQWNPMWSVSSIIQGVQSFMASSELTTGAIQNPSESEQRKLATLSIKYNEKNFTNLFDGNIQAAFDRADDARMEAERKKLLLAAGGNSNTGTGSKKAKSKTTKETTDNTKKDGKEPGTEKESGTKEEEEEEDNVNKVDLTPEEIEKRRKKNAKKRAKQKAKKNASTSGTATTSENE